MRKRLVIVTCRKASAERGRDLVETVDRALAALPQGAAWVQLREKDLASGDLLNLGRQLVEVTRLRGAKLLVNDRLDVALAAEADGVHLPENGLGIADVRAVVGAMPFVVGRSVHSAEGAKAAAMSGADVILCGPIWDTPSKRAFGAPLGEDVLREAARRAREQNSGTEIYAVGGVTDGRRAQAAFRAGADGCAVIRAVMAADDPGAAAAALWSAMT